MIEEEEDPIARNGLSSHWYVLHVKPRCEKKVRAWLSAFHYLHILPTWTETRRIQRRLVVTEIPVFPGYVFARLMPEQYPIALQSHAIANLIPVTDSRTLVHQVHQVIKAARMTRGMVKVPVYKEGDLVRIKRGPFKGVEGRFKRTRGKECLVLNVETLGCGMEITLNTLDCEKI